MRALCGQDGRAGKGKKELLVSQCACHPRSPRDSHCSTCPRVSGSFRARELPRARAAEAKRMGTALVIPTKDVKMLIPSTAASLHRAFRKPKAVVLLRSPPAQHAGCRGPAQEGDKGRGMGGFVGEGWVGGKVKERWQAVSKRERKDGEIREVRDAYQGIQINWEARRKGHQKIRLIVKTARSEYKSYQLVEEKLKGNMYPFTPKDAFPNQPPSSPHFCPVL